MVLHPLLESRLLTGPRMLFATFLGLLLIPVFYIVVRRLLGDKLDGDGKPHPASGTGMQSFDSDPQRGH